MRKWMLIGGWGLMAMAAQAQAPDTTLAWLTEAAVDRHPSVRAAAYAAAGARERAAAAGALPDPSVRLAYNVSGGSGSAWGRASAGLMQAVPWPGLRQAGRDAAHAAAAARGHARDVARVAVVRDLHTAWHARHAQARQAELLRDHQAWLARLEALARQRLAAGTASRADLIRLEMEREEVASKIRGLDIESAATDAVIRRLAGLDDSESFTPPAGPIRPLAFTPPDTASHPMLAESEAMADEAARMARIATLETRPMIEVGMELMGPRFFGMGRETMILPAVTLSLPIWRDANRARVAESAMSADAAIQRRNATRLSLLNEREMALARYREAVIRVDLYASSLLPRSIELADLTLTEYSGGRATADEVIRARRASLDVALALAQARSDVNRSVVLLQSLYPGLP